MRFEVTFTLEGPEDDLDGHQNHVHELANLAEMPVQFTRVDGRHLKTICIFEADSKTDAVFMGVGLLKPQDSASKIEIDRGQVRPLS